MNVIIPLGGVGSRFSSEGYARPKPLIRVLGTEMIFWVLDSLTVTPEDQIIIVYLPSFLGCDFERIVNVKYPAVKFVRLAGQTKGAAETVLHGLKALTKKQIGRPVMLFDGDAFYDIDVVEQFRAIAPKAGAVFCFKAKHTRPIFSYVTRLADDTITDIKEKEMISEWANCGTYCFQNGKDLIKYINVMIDRNETQRGEYYTSGVIKIMLEAGHTFKAVEVDAEKDFHVLGTPLQVEEFCATWPHQEAKRWCFDLDNTLVTHPTVAGDYSTCEPIPHMVKVVRDLHAAGHYIIISTARRMRTHNGNIGGVTADIGVVTFRTLKEIGIPYDEIFFGKPWAQFYVDDLAVDPLRTSQTVAKQTGFHSSAIKAVRFDYSSNTSATANMRPDAWMWNDDEWADSMENTESVAKDSKKVSTDKMW
eukprot:CAMPEP_0198228712 /NCGR_PEP_ID=MMETSP1445-20131203/113742_1 /TAXON_ID=36898 /ORGANISM="Pyramimonas sp., Strain CCMP2087" /LENGTH=419 /DNA_ID=CAMNT_0043909131 /DNA_START=99 /DNA_END=1355 /DNA_ORIENTATION=-